jgi:hypothetical protein
MPDHLRALLVILILAPIVFRVARSATASLIIDDDFIRRRNLWIVLTLVAFLSHNFWLCIFASGILLWRDCSRDKNPLALYFFVLFAVPPLVEVVPGFGLVNYIFSIDYLRLLSLAVLLPAATKLMRDSANPSPGSGLCDRLLLAYVGYNLALIFLSGTVTNSLRSVFIHTIDILLPYYVASRSLRRPEQFRDAMASFVVGAGVLAAIGIFESAKGWVIYSALRTSLDNHTQIMNQLLRGDIQRAMGSTGQPIAFGYVMLVAIGFWLCLQPHVKKPVERLLPLLLLVVALIATLSRGPWAGAAIVWVIFVFTGPQLFQRVAKMGLLVVATGGLAMLIPGGKQLIDILPFIGESEGGTVSYRQQLIDVFVPIILDNPFSGASGKLDTDEVEALRQGEGIIDVVNSFIGVGLSSGVVGVLLFTGFFVGVGTGVWQQLHRQTSDDTEVKRLGQAVLAVLAGILVTIFTVSSITVIPYIYWAVAGIGVAYMNMGSAPKTAKASLLFTESKMQ